MMAICEICGKQVRKDLLYSNTREDGKRKNRGECDACAKDLEVMLTHILDRERGQDIKSGPVALEKYQVTAGDRMGLDKGIIDVVYVESADEVHSQFHRMYSEDYYEIETVSRLQN